jgi:hypothetical protein
MPPGAYKRALHGVIKASERGGTPFQEVLRGFQGVWRPIEEVINEG